MKGNFYKKFYKEDKFIRMWCGKHARKNHLLIDKKNERRIVRRMEHSEKEREKLGYENLK